MGLIYVTPFCPQSIVNGRATKEMAGVQWNVVQGQWTGHVKNQ